MSPFVGLPQHLRRPDDINKILNCIDQSFICPGNKEDKFVDMCVKRGGIIKSNRGHGETIATLDDILNSVRRIDCTVITVTDLQRCQPCQKLRGTLRTSISRANTTITDPVNTSSHVPYKNLTSKQKDERLQHVKSSLKVANQKIKRLEDKALLMIEKQGLQLPEDDSEDITALMRNMDSYVQSTYEEATPQQIF